MTESVLWLAWGAWVSPDRDLFLIRNHPDRPPKSVAELNDRKNMTLFHFIGLTSPRTFVDLLRKVLILGSFIVNIDEAT